MTAENTVTDYYRQGAMSSIRLLSAVWRAKRGKPLQIEQESVLEESVSAIVAPAMERKERGQDSALVSE